MYIFPGLQEFVANSSKKESPHVPTKSPKQSILKESLSPVSVFAKSSNSSKSCKSGNKHKRLSSSPLAHFSESSTTTKLKFSSKKHSKKIRKPKVHWQENNNENNDVIRQLRMITLQSLETLLMLACNWFGFGWVLKMTKCWISPLSPHTRYLLWFNFYWPLFTIL